MSEPANQASKKRNKKRKKRGGKADPGAGENGGEHTDKMPKVREACPGGGINLDEDVWIWSDLSGGGRSRRL